MRVTRPASRAPAARACGAPPSTRDREFRETEGVRNGLYVGHAIDHRPAGLAGRPARSGPVVGDKATPKRRDLIGPSLGRPTAGTLVQEKDGVAVTRPKIGRGNPSRLLHLGDQIKWRGP